jgi:outer membrane protein assembly factor BamB
VIVWGDGYGFLHGFGMPADGEFPHLWQMDLNPEEFRYRDDEELPYPRHHGPREAKEFGPGHVIAKPVYHDGRIYIGTGRDHYYTSHPGGRIATPGVFLCIDASDPTDISREDILWQKRLVVTQSTASIKDGLLYISDGTGVIRCLDASTGETYWEHDMGGDVTCRSQILADGKVYIGTDRKMFYIFEDSRTKNVLFEAQLDGRTSTVGAVDGFLVVATERSIRAYEPKN